MTWKWKVFIIMCFLLLVPYVYISIIFKVYNTKALETLASPASSMASPSLLASSPPPNIMIILADDLGFNDVSWHNQIVKTPHMEKLAREGIILEQHYSQATCSPTRAALLTGRYPIHTGLHNGVIFPLTPYGLDTSFKTLADEFKSLNYSTHAIGKWHLGFCNKKYWPTNRGFDHHFGYLTGAQDYFTHKRKKGYDFRDDEAVFYDKGTYSTKLFQNRAIEVIKSHDARSPLFLYLPFQSVHTPLQKRRKKEVYKFINNSDREILLSMVTDMDDAVGEIVQTLKDTGLYNNTIVLFLSDNGGAVQAGANNWPLRGSKGSLWEGGTRTASFIHFPKLLKPRIDHGLVHVSDWYPTLLSAAGKSSTSQDLDGVDQWPRMLDPNLPRPRQEMVYDIDTRNPQINSAIRVGDWKYVSRSGGYSGWYVPAEQENNGEMEKQFEDFKNGNNTSLWDIRCALFNLAKDPSEKEDLSAVYPERAEELFEKLKGYQKNMFSITFPEETEAGEPSNFNGIWSCGWC